MNGHAESCQRGSYWLSWLPFVWVNTQWSGCFTAVCRDESWESRRKWWAFCVDRALLSSVQYSFLLSAEASCSLCSLVKNNTSQICTDKWPGPYFLCFFFLPFWKSDALADSASICCLCKNCSLWILWRKWHRRHEFFLGGGGRVGGRVALSMGLKWDHYATMVLLVC